jgi:hypothetical protein
MASKLELEEYLYRRAIGIIESTDTDYDKENLLFQEVWLPLAKLYQAVLLRVVRCLPPAAGLSADTRT